MFNIKTPPKDIETPRKQALKRKIKEKTHQTRKDRMANLRLKKKVVKKTRFSYDELLANGSVHLKTFLNMQLYHKSRSTWSSSEKRITVSFYYKSPSFYQFMRNKLKFVLPGISTIRKWLSVINLQAGFNNKTYLQMLKQKLTNNPEQEQNCILLIDEMGIKKRISYNRRIDLLKGFWKFG